MERSHGRQAKLWQGWRQAPCQHRRLCAAALWGSAAMASPCRVTDFTDKPLAALSEVQRLALVTEMTRTEYDRIKAAVPGSPNHYKLVADSATIPDARVAASARFATLKLDHVDEYRTIWGSDFLDDEQLRKFTDCITQRQPGWSRSAGREPGDVPSDLFAHHPDRHREDQDPAGRLLQHRQCRRAGGLVQRSRPAG